MQDSRAILNEHPSVQDLDVKCGRLNEMKVLRNAMMANSGPLTSGHVPKNAKKEAKDQTTKVFKHDANLIAAANRPRSDIVAPKPKKQPPTAPPVKKAVPSNSGSAIAASTASRSKTPSLPPVSNTKSAGSTKKPPPSVVTSVLSYEGTDAESFSMYSCSCCGVRPPSSVVSKPYSKVPSVVPSSTCDNLSAYENLTSISQRIAQDEKAHRSSRRHHHRKDGDGTSTVASTKLRDLETQLAQEREDRERTQQELKAIQERQLLLMSKLSDREREEFAKAAGKK